MKPFVLALIFGVPALASAIGGACAAQPALFLPLLWFHTWVFAFDHVVATYTRLVGRRFLLFVLPPLVFLLVYGVSALAGLAALTTTYFLGQWFHTTRQSWGIARHYGAERGVLSQLTLWALPIAGILHRCQQQPTQFLSLPLALPPIPASAVVAAVTGACGLLLVFAWRRPPAAPYLLTHHAVYALAYLVLDDLQAGWLLINVWHNVQYLLFVWHKNQGRRDVPVLAWLCQPGRWRAVAYFAACFAVSTPTFAAVYAITDRVNASLTLWVALAINFHHYIVDAIIWRRPAAPPSRRGGHRVVAVGGGA